MKLCCVFNFNPLYRFPIFKAIDETFDCDFYFGDSVFQNIERFDAEQLKGFKHYLHARKLIGGYVWHSEITGIFSRHYTHYLLTGSSSYLVNWLIYAYAFITKKKVYLWTHGINAPVERKLSQLHCRLFFLPATGIFLYGHHAIPYMEAIGCKREKLYVIHNSLNTSLQTELFEKGLRSSIYTDYFKNSNPVAIYIGRLQKRKQLDLLIKAIAYCQAEGNPVNLVLVGPKEDDESVLSLVSELGLDSTIWLFGASYDEEISSKLIFNADVCVCPSAVGLTAIHALSYGTPVVSNDDFSNQMPEYEAIVDGETGSFYEKGNAFELSKHIWRWCSATDAKRQAIRTKARHTVINEWSVEYQIDLLKRVLQDK